MTPALVVLKATLAFVVIFVLAYAYLLIPDSVKERVKRNKAVREMTYDCNIH
jgi:hypothetical protein